MSVRADIAETRQRMADRLIPGLVEALNELSEAIEAGASGKELLEAWQEARIDRGLALSAACAELVRLEEALAVVMQAEALETELERSAAGKLEEALSADWEEPALPTTGKMAAAGECVPRPFLFL